MSVDTPAKRAIKRTATEVAPSDTAQQAGEVASAAATATDSLARWLAFQLEHQADTAAGRAEIRKILAGLSKHFSTLTRAAVALHHQILLVGSTGAANPDPLIAFRYEKVRRAFDSDADIAELMEVDRSQVTRWKHGARPDPRNFERLLGLETIVSLLEGFLERGSIPKWLNGINAHLGDRRPLDVLKEGKLSEVIRAIEAERSGAFA